MDYEIFLHDVQEPIRPLLAEEVRRQNGVKFHLIADIRFRKSTDPNEIQEWDIVSRAIRLLPIDNIDGALEGICSDVSRKIEEYIERGTGWVVDQLNFIDLYINRYRPLRGNSYFPTPKQLAAKKAILNIKNKDQKCFLWCVLAHLHPVDHADNANRVSKYKRFQNELNTAELNFPVSLASIDQFEDANDLAINVYGYNNDLHPLRCTSKRNSPHPIVNLLLLTKDNRQHYCLIRDLNRLLGDQTRHNGRKFFCAFCLMHYSTQERLAFEVYQVQESNVGAPHACG